MFWKPPQIMGIPTTNLNKWVCRRTINSTIKSCTHSTRWSPSRYKWSHGVKWLKTNGELGWNIPTLFHPIYKHCRVPHCRHKQNFLQSNWGYRPAGLDFTKKKVIPKNPLAKSGRRVANYNVFQLSIFQGYIRLVFFPNLRGGFFSCNFPPVLFVCIEAFNQ